jgi:hypothetical protein
LARAGNWVCFAPFALRGLEVVGVLAKSVPNPQSRLPRFARNDMIRNREIGFVWHESSPQRGRRPQPKPARAETRRRRETQTVIAERNVIPAKAGKRKKPKKGIGPQQPPGGYRLLPFAF